MSIYNIYLFIRLPWKFVCQSHSVKVLTFTSMSRKSKVVSILNIYTYSHWWAPFKWGSFWWPWYLNLAVGQSGNYWTDKVKVISPLTMDVRMSNIAKPLLISLMTGYGKKTKHYRLWNFYSSCICQDGRTSEIFVTWMMS